MKHAYAGTTIEIRGAAWFASFGEAVPIFHAWRAPADGKLATTRCGLELARAHERQNGKTIEMLLSGLPPRLGVKIGRPCVRCWPELRRQQSLFARPHRATRAEQEALEV